LSSTDMVAEGTRNVYIRLRNMPSEDLKKLEQALRQKFNVLYLAEDILKEL